MSGKVRSPDTFETLRVKIGYRLALLVPLVEMGQLAKKHRSLNRVEPRGPADELVLVLPLLAVFAQCPDPSCELGIACHQRAGVADRSEVLGGIEAECRADSRSFPRVRRRDSRRVPGMRLRLRAGPEPDARALIRGMSATRP